MKVMQTFADGREAKEFLIDRIVGQAQREGIPLSKVEEKMLYFSETAWTLPDIWEVNEAFDQEYDQAEYEVKIASLIRDFHSYAETETPADLESWDEAVRTLRREDHYLLVMIDAKSQKPSTFIGGFNIGGNRFLKLMVAGVPLFLICAIGFMYLSSRL